MNTGTEEHKKEKKTPPKKRNQKITATPKTTLIKTDKNTTDANETRIK